MSSHPRPKIRLDSQPQTLTEKIMEEDVIDLYVQNIPNDLTREGLENIFLRAGTIENVKIIPSKIPDSTSTYGFVRFKSKTAAMKAIQMFNNHKIGGQNLRVRFAKPQANKNTATASNGNENGGGDYNNRSRRAKTCATDDDEDWEKDDKSTTSQRLNESKYSSSKTLDNGSHKNAAEDNESIVSMNSNLSKNAATKKPMGRGQLINSVIEKYETDMLDLDISRPYARRVMSNRTSLNNTIESNVSLAQSSKSKVAAKISSFDRKSSISKYSSKTDLSRTATRLKKGESYEVEITCAFNPAYFYIQTATNMDKVGILLNNMDNCYRNEDEFNDIKSLKVGDFCACHVDSFWYRGQIIALDGLKYKVRLTDFGDFYVLAQDEVTILKPEFCEYDCYAIRCALANVKPLKSDEWSPDTIDLLKNLIYNESRINSNKPKEHLVAKIIDYEFDSENNEICLVQLFLNNENIVDYLSTQRYAEIRNENLSETNNKHTVSQINNNIDSSKKSLSRLTSFNSSFCTEANSVVDDDVAITGEDLLLNNLNSVSQQNLNKNDEQLRLFKNQNYQQSTCTLANTMSNSIQRTKLFNCTFKVWKWKDFKYTQSYTCSPKLIEVLVSNVFSTDNFYIQRLNDINSINYLTECLQKYANTLLGDEMMHPELYNYMMYSSKFDVVLAKSSFDQKWKRAIILDKYTADTFYDSCSSNLNININIDNIGYFNVLFIDHGFEELIEYRKILEDFNQRMTDLIVLLPINAKLNQLEPYALKCSLSQTNIKRHYLANKNKFNNTNLLYEKEFEIKFRNMFNINKGSCFNYIEAEKKFFLMKLVQVENFKSETEAIIELFKIDINNNKINIIDFINSQIILQENNEKLTDTNFDEVNKKIMEKAYKEELAKPKSQDQAPELVAASKDTKSTITTVTKASTTSSSTKSLVKDNVDQQATPTKSKSKQILNTLKYVELLNVGEKYDVTVIYVSELKKIFLLPTSQIDQIVEIQQDINNDDFIMKNTSEIKNTKINNGDLIIAYYESDLYWYRAIVVDNKPNENNQIKLFFVDYGNEEYISITNCRSVNSLVDNKIVQQTFKINNCELNFLENVNNDDKFIFEKLKELEGKEVIIKILHIYMPTGTTSSSKMAHVEDYLPKYLINLYMDKNDEANNEQRLFNKLTKQKQQQQQQKQPQLSKSDSSQFADADEDKTLINAIQQKFTKLEKTNIYKVNIQYIDENSGHIYFYLSENIEKLNQLQVSLQDDTEKSVFEQLKTLNDIRQNEQYEALFKDDAKWYRCVINKINKKENYVEVYFVDYGNLEVIDLNQVKLCDYLRKRKVIKDEIYNISYQAVKCSYVKSFSEFTVDVPKFIEDVNDNDAFYIKCVDILADKNDNTEFESNVYVFELVQYENETDKEVSDILENSLKMKGSQQLEEPAEEKENIETFHEIDTSIDTKLIDLEVNANKFYEITLTFINNTSEIYVQLNENFNALITQQQHLQLLMEKLTKLNIKSSDKFKIGDYVVAKYSFDSAWYRGVVTNELADTQEYEIYFVDYGNKEVSTTDSVYRITDLYKLIDLSQQQHDANNNDIFSLSNVDSLVNFKYQAILCKLNLIKKCTRNTEILRTLMNDCLNFNMIIVSDDKCVIGGTSENENNLCMINRYAIELYTDTELLNDRFEKEQVEKIQTKKLAEQQPVKQVEPPAKPQQHKEVEKQPQPIQQHIESEKQPQSTQKSEIKQTTEATAEPTVGHELDLEVNKTYKCRYVFVETLNEFFVHLIDNDPYLSQLEEYLTELTEKPRSSLTKYKTLPKKNDLVLAKFYLNETESKWYRAKVIDVKNENEIKVFFIDYGNSDEKCCLDNILKITNNDLDDIIYLPQLAYCIKLNKINIDVEKHQDILNTMMEQESILIKCISIEKNNDLLKYNVEVNDITGETCFNKLFDPNYKQEDLSEQQEEEEELSKLIDQSNTDRLVVDPAKHYKVNYTFLDSFDNPIYFTLDNDSAALEEFNKVLNDYYNSKSNKSEQINDDNELKVNEYYAAKLNDGFWYRIKLLEIDRKTKLMKCKALDHGYTETDVCYFDGKEYLIRKLNKIFYKQYRFAFKIYLIDLNTNEKLEYKNVKKCAEIFEAYFFDSINEDKKNDIKMRIYSRTLEQQGSINDTDYVYYVELLNNKNESLNKLIEHANQTAKIPKSTIKDKFLKTNMKKMPKQQFDSKQTYKLFTQRIDLFYLYDENSIAKILAHVNETCSDIVSLNYKFNFETNSAANMPEVGNLVFSRYDDETCWYRCVITNISAEYDKVELFFLDYGNTEIVEINEILLPYDEKHLECFYKYPAQAYKSRLYGLKLNNNNSNNENAIKAFKDYVSGKEFQVKLIKKFLDNNVNCETYLHEVQLIQYKTNLDVHSYLIENNYAGFEPFELILKAIKTNEEIQFYKERLDLQKERLGL